ncbi:interleukin 15, like isoform X2 [Eucyclogobius newberryi]|uniref:interleukin 15, like isoform X2 n=1 Tax=Eucyclogobius newberryi TaxID=166745 RepID=UPI003B597035
MLRGSVDDETMLYTPDQQQYERCPSFSMGCMVKEMKTLLNDWTIVDGNITTRTFRILNKVKNWTKSLDKDCVPGCESFKEESALIFLEFLNKMLQKFNTDCSLLQRVTRSSLNRLSSTSWI